MRNLTQLRASGLLAILLIGLAGSLQAQIAGLVYDSTLDELSVASIDTASGAVTPAATTVSECCILPAGLISADAEAERFYAIGEATGGPLSGQLALLALDYDGESIAFVPLAATPEAILEFDSANGRLVSMTTVDPATGVQLISIDPANGAVSPIGSPNAGCCEVATGISALDPAAQILYFAGRAGGETDWSLYAADLATGLVSPIEELGTGSPGFMAVGADSGLIEVLMQAGLDQASQLIGVDLINGGTQVLAEHPDGECCLLTPGQTPTRSASGDGWWLSGSSTSLEVALVALSRAGQPGVSRLQPITSGYRLFAVVINGSALGLDALFSDRFQL